MCVRKTTRRRQWFFSSHSLPNGWNTMSGYMVIVTLGGITWIECARCGEFQLFFLQRLQRLARCWCCFCHLWIRRLGRFHLKIEITENTMSSVKWFRNFIKSLITISEIRSIDLKCVHEKLGSYLRFDFSPAPVDQSYNTICWQANTSWMTVFLPCHTSCEWEQSNWNENSRWRRMRCYGTKVGVNIRHRACMDANCVTAHATKEVFLLFWIL